jgi:hypothetical protein
LVGDCCAPSASHCSMCAAPADPSARWRPPSLAALAPTAADMRLGRCGERRGDCSNKKATAEQHACQHSMHHTLPDQTPQSC